MTVTNKWALLLLFAAFCRITPSHLQALLPYWTAAEDIPDFLLDGNEPRQACWADRITDQNTQQPVIAFVNRETWQVALEQGRRLDLEEMTSLDCSRVGMCCISTGRDDATWMTLRVRPPCSCELEMQPSVMAEIIHPSSLKTLLDGADASDSPCLLYHSQRNKVVVDIAYYAQS
ncbi:hypothetical protein IFM47457_05161 [Aspergillus lentulus]|nr:hypothetical protein IFM47457_05161 [Aspergillus lentulus]